MLKKYIIHQLLILLLLCLTAGGLFGQNISVTKIEPPNWWVGMKWNAVQLMVYGKNLQGVSARFKDPRITVREVQRIANPAYAFIDIEIPDDLPPGNYTLQLQRGDETLTVDYPLLARESGGLRHQGFSPSDVVYLITPDRFANGDPANDMVPEMGDTLDRAHHYRRHGGDIQGIIDRLDYLQDLGITAIWINPLVENRMRRNSYHGYAATDFYRIDPRFGTNELYKQLVTEAHRRDLKIIIDHVSNHCGSGHPWLANPPVPGWFNDQGAENPEITHHYKYSFSDPHADSASIANTTRGWFVRYMPDLNQANPFMHNYIIQNTIWWMEYSGLDGIREDTYPYADQQFLADWAAAVRAEYPGTNIVGEIWEYDPPIMAYSQANSKFPRPFDSNLPCVTDFAFGGAFHQYLAEDAKLNVFYKILAQDFLYADPYNLLTFGDNHDMPRLMFLANGDAEKVKLALALLLTTRGIPQIYYGTEIGMVGGKDHGSLRKDFPGGFPGDERDAFTAAGRTDQENDIFNYLRELLHLRKQHSAFADGKLTHFPPRDGAYVYFRNGKDERLMVAINNHPKAQELPWHHYTHAAPGAKLLRNLRNGETVTLGSDAKITVTGRQAAIFEVLER